MFRRYLRTERIREVLRTIRCINKHINVGIGVDVDNRICSSPDIRIRDRPKTDFPFTAENETGVENGSSFSAVNKNENETDEKYSQPTVEVNL